MEGTNSLHRVECARGRDPPRRDQPRVCSNSRGGADARTRTRSPGRQSSVGLPWIRRSAPGSRCPPGGPGAEPRLRTGRRHWCRAAAVAHHGSAHARVGPHAGNRNRGRTARRSRRAVTRVRWSSTAEPVAERTIRGPSAHPRRRTTPRPTRGVHRPAGPMAEAILSATHVISTHHAWAANASAWTVRVGTHTSHQRRPHPLYGLYRLLILRKPQVTHHCTSPEVRAPRPRRRSCAGTWPASRVTCHRVVKLGSSCSAAGC